MTPASTVAVQHLEDEKRSKTCGIVGLVLICIGIFHTFVLIQLTPVYTETECGHQEAELKNFAVGVREIHVDLEISVTCTNPNPYKIDILSSTPGRVYVGVGAREEVGKLKVVPGSSLPEKGTGKVRVQMNAVISGADSDRLLPHFLADSAVPILMELQFNVGVYVSFGLGFGSWGTVAPFKKACGLKMLGLLVNQFVSAQDTRKRGRLGPLVCRDSFNGIVIPPIGEAAETPEDGNMGFSAAQVAPTEVEAGEAVKNFSLGLIISLSFFVGTVMLYTFFYGETPAMLKLETLSSLVSTLTQGSTTSLPAAPYANQPAALQPLTAKEEGEDEEAVAGGWTRPSFQRKLTHPAEEMLRAAGVSPTRAARGLSGDAGSEHLAGKASDLVPAGKSRDETKRLVTEPVPVTHRQDSSITSAGFSPDAPVRRGNHSRRSDDKLARSSPARTKGRSSSPGGARRAPSADSLKKSRSPSLSKSSAAYEVGAAADGAGSAAEADARPPAGDPVASV
eukprot:gb/GFBE01025679.1/.p1 GENE.gb/GFBE01025679.1/~~gb/GFBE01025679.1/.p1  ORF type:complete len:508 (+),score=77.61 gb/GFBE01025679.1/:1-1524(+)